MKTRYLYTLRFILILTDLLVLNVAYLASYFIIANQFQLKDQYIHYLVISNLLWLLSSSIFGSYTAHVLQKIELIYKSTIKSAILHCVLFVFYLTFSKDVAFSRNLLLLFYATLSVGLLFSRFTGTMIQMLLKKHFNIRKPVAVLGMNTTGLRLAGFFENNKSNFSFEGFLDENNGLYVDVDGNILPSATEQIKLAAQNGIKEVYVSLTPDRMAEAGNLLQEAERQCVRLKLVPDLSQSLAAPFQLNYMGDFPVISLRKEPLEHIENRFRKRIFDLFFSSLVILFVLSWLYPIIALLIKMESKGPVLFKQLRSGRDNASFWCYKFRSMTVNNDSDTKQASKDDARVTSIGKFLRKTSLDELPQFFNVFFGDMSVVGPRPHMLKHTEQYKAIIDQFMVRHFTKPGITGWAQVSGFRGETKEHSQMESRVEHDIWYLENWSLMLDIKIIFMTIINVIKGEENAF